MPALNRDRPYANFNFLVEFDGSPAGSFMEVSGLEAQVEPIEYRSGNDQVSSVRKTAGLTKYTNVTLKRGVVSDTSLFQWFKDGLGGTGQRKEVKITLMEEAGQPVLAWTLHRAWPVKWSGPSLNAKGSDVAIETIDLTHEGIDMEKF